MEFLKKIEYRLIPVVIGMETSGFLIDKEKLLMLKDELLKSKEQIEKKYAFNLNSPKQLREHMIASGYGKELSTYVTYNQVPSTDKLALKAMLQRVPMAGDILIYREVSKLLSTYVEVMSGKEEWKGNFNQLGTMTGRFSSSKPNLQNIPARTELGRRLRECLIARPGHRLIISDMSQIEPRLYAFFSKDKKLLDIYKTGGDFHTDVTKTIYSLNGVPPTKDQRFVGKTVGLATLYGAGVSKLLETLVKNNVFMSEKDVANIRNKIRFNYRVANDWFWKYKKQAYSDGYVGTLLGRKIPVITGMNPVNTKIQASCADILKVCMVNIHFAGYKIIATIHDEIVCEVEDWNAGKAARDISDIMSCSVNLSGMALIADTVINNSWKK